jgi:hypothetical protein
MRISMRVLPILLTAALYAAPLQAAAPSYSNPVMAPAAGATTPRAYADRAADVVNVRDFGADPTGVADSAPAFTAAIASVPSGTVRLYVPHGTYRLNSWVSDNNTGRVHAELDDGALVGANYGGLGSGVLYVGRVQQRMGAASAMYAQGGGSLDTLAYASNTNVAAGAFNSTYQGYNAYVTNANGGDVAWNYRSWWLSPPNTGLFHRWEEAITPLSDLATTGWNSRDYSGGMVEYNPVMNGPEPASGWYDPSVGSSPSNTEFHGLNVVPDPWAPTGNFGGNLSYAYATDHSQPNWRWSSYPAVFSTTGNSGWFNINAVSPLSGTDAFSVNGTTISGWTTGNNSEVASKVAAAGIANVSASVDDFGRVVIYSTLSDNSGSITLANVTGTPLGKLGMSARMYTTSWARETIIRATANPASVGTGSSIVLNGVTIALNKGTGTPADIASAINGAGIPYVSAGVAIGNQLVITGGIQSGSKPISLTIANGTGTPLTTLNITPGTHNPSGPPTSATGSYLQGMWNGFLAGRDSIAYGGRAFLADGGSTSTAKLMPYAPLEARYNWSTGLHTDQATFADNNALVMGTGQAIQWGNSTVRLTASGTDLAINGTTLGSTYAKLSGATFTGGITAPTGYFNAGSLNVVSNSGNASEWLSGPAGNSKEVYFQTAGTNRWGVGALQNAETGSNAGSDFTISSFSDAGAYIGQPLSITRSSGIVNIPYGIAVSGTASITGTRSTGLHTDQATITDNNALVMGAGQALQWGTSSTVRLTASGTDLAVNGTALGSTYGKLSGGTYTGQLYAPGFYSNNGTLNVVTSSGNAAEWISAPSGNTKQVNFQTSGSNRWSVGGNGTTESGSNVGTDFTIGAFSDTATYLGAALTITRSTQVANFAQTPVVGSAPVVTRVAVPATSTSACTTGQEAASSTYFYVCVAANTWMRAALSSF